MESYLLSGFLGFVMVNMLFASGRGQVSFFQNYNVTWGNSHFSTLNNDTTAQLTMNQSSGAGFGSKSHILSGSINMSLNIPQNKSPGVITAFYLISKETQHDEIDFEFFGTNGPPYVLSTNIFTKGVGGREQKFNLWFDPTANFHSYTILWNQYLVVFFVDDTPIRVFKNSGDKGNYPTQGMVVEASVWNASWAGMVDWSKAPFTAQYQGFDIDGCVVSDPSNPGSCNYTHGSAWAQIQTLSADQLAKYQHATSNYLVYDYCTDKTRHPQPPPECTPPTAT